MTGRPRRLPPDQPQTWYFTFGVGLDQPNRGRYYMVENASYDEARTRMVEKFGLDWAFQYDAAGWYRDDGVSQEERWNLERIPD